MMIFQELWKKRLDPMIIYEILFNDFLGLFRFATESFDDMGPVGEDPRWDVFHEFHDYLAKIYPNVYDP